MLSRNYLAVSPKQVASQKNVDDMICEKRAHHDAPLQVTTVLVGAGFCLSELKDNHHAILWLYRWIGYPQFIYAGASSLSSDSSKTVSLLVISCV